MSILIANDDGVYIPGIIVLVVVATRYVEGPIVGTDAEQSSIWHAITANRPLDYQSANTTVAWSKQRIRWAERFTGSPWYRSVNLKKVLIDGPSNMAGSR